MKQAVLKLIPNAYAAFLGSGITIPFLTLGRQMRSPVKGWIIRRGGPHFWPLTLKRRETEAEAWADAVAILSRGQPRELKG